jgi:hypothetical protein
MNNAHTAAAAQVIANAIAQLEAINADAQAIIERAYDLNDMTDPDTIRDARKALRIIEATGALQALKAVQL